MEGCQRSAGDARPFVSTPYVSEGGELVPVPPEAGPCAGFPGACDLAQHRRRRRNTGPPLKLAQFRCATHRRYFTAYPRGWAPYRRERVRATSPDGSEVLEPEVTGRERFEGTLLEPIVEAARGEVWSREAEGADGRWGASQRRRVVEALQLLGLAITLPAGVRERITEALDVDGCLVADACTLGEDGRVACAEAACRVLDALEPRNEARLLEAGHLAGLWGEPLRWCPRSNRLERSPFRLPGTRAPPG